jgi:hypothetical protein
VTLVRVGKVLQGGPARMQLASANRKLSPVDLVDVGGSRKRPIPRGPFCCSTYVSIEATCSSACPFKGAGCYVQAGFTGRAVRQLDELAVGSSSLDVSLAEVAVIDGAFRKGVPQDGARGGRDLRLHDSGDASTVGGAIMLGEAAARWRARGGGSVWTYTHAWRDVDRSNWGPSVSVLASVEKPADIPRARAHGYAPAIVVERHKSAAAYELEGTRVIPCPAETLGKTCVECRLCLDRDLYGMSAGIAFAVHGTTGRPRLDGSKGEPKRALLALRVANQPSSSSPRGSPAHQEA